MTSIEMFRYVVVPLLGLVGTLCSVYVVFRLNSSDKLLESMTKRQTELEKDITKNYMDKAEVQNHFDMQLAPIRDSLTETSHVLKAVAGKVEGMANDISVLKYLAEYNKGRNDN